MKLLENLSKVCTLFKPTFCRSFILYGSNIICCSPNVISIAKSTNLGLYNEVESMFNLTDDIARYLNPAYEFAFTTVYHLNGFKFYMATYWQFMVIKAANNVYKINHDFRYIDSMNRLNSFMCINRCDSYKLRSWCIMIFGDALSLTSSVGEYVEKMYDAKDSDIVKWLNGRWLSLEDLPYDYVKNSNKRLDECGCMVKDLSYLSKQYSAYEVEVGTIADAVAIYEDTLMQFHEYISQL